MFQSHKCMPLWLASLKRKKKKKKTQLKRGKTKRSTIHA